MRRWRKRTGGFLFLKDTTERVSSSNNVASFAATSSSIASSYTAPSSSSTVPPLPYSSLRRIVIDGSNVAMAHGNNKVCEASDESCYGCLFFNKNRLTKRDPLTWPYWGPTSIVACVKSIPNWLSRLQYDKNDKNDKNDKYDRMTTWTTEYSSEYLLKQS